MAIKQTTMVLSNGGMYTLQGMSYEDCTKRWRIQLDAQAVMPMELTVSWPTDESPELEVRLKDIIGFMRQNDMHLVPS